MEAILIKGTVVNLAETVEVGEKKFKKRDIAVELEGGGQYTQEVLLQGVKDTCDKMDDLVPGTEASFHVNLNGRKWTNKEGVDQWFNTLQIWKFEVNKSVPVSTPQYAQPADISANPEEDDLPF